MTTIAYRDGVMACDSCWTMGSEIDTLTTKISRLPNGALFGQAGMNDGRAVVKLMKEKNWELPSFEELMQIRLDSTNLLVFKDGRIFKIVTVHIPPEIWDKDTKESIEDLGCWEVNRTFTAIGSGGPYAMGAMLAGVGAPRAVEIACQMDIYSRPPIDNLFLK
jgi:ATP-dependent protease HslVU (ClpYQ) peptidase subunit